MKYIVNVSGGLTSFEAELGGTGAAVDVSLYLGVHWRSGGQRVVFEQALGRLGPRTTEGHVALVQPSVNPHQLDVAYSHHALSLSSVREFFLERNSSMEAYLAHQRAWEQAEGKGQVMPTHSSGEAERLVTVPSALRDPRALPERVMRRAVSSGKSERCLRIS